MKKIILFITLAVFLASCSSVPKDLKDENVTPEEFFQKAQEAVINWNRYKLAIVTQSGAHEDPAFRIGERCNFLDWNSVRLDFYSSMRKHTIAVL